MAFNIRGFAQRCRATQATTRMLNMRRKHLGPVIVESHGRRYKDHPGRGVTSEQDIWLDQELPLTRQEWQQHHRNKLDMMTLAYLAPATLAFGPIGLVGALAAASTSKFNFPSDFWATEDMDEDDKILYEADQKLDDMRLGFAYMILAQAFVRGAGPKINPWGWDDHTEDYDMLLRPFQRKDLVWRDPMLCVRIRNNFEHMVGFTTLARIELQTVAEFWGLNKFENSSSIKSRLIEKFQFLLQDDLLIAQGGGMSTLNDKQLLAVCVQRCLCCAHEGLNRESLEDRYSTWMFLTENRVPPLLLTYWCVGYFTHAGPVSIPSAGYEQTEAPELPDLRHSPSI